MINMGIVLEVEKKQNYRGVKWIFLNKEYE